MALLETVEARGFDGPCRLLWDPRGASPLPSRTGIPGAVVTTSDKDPDFTDEFCEFLQRHVGGVDAAELLLLLAKDRPRWWEVSELHAQLAVATTLAESDVLRYLDVLQHGTLVTRDADRRVRYRSSPSHDAFVANLARLYLERPVTLFRVIYALRDAKIKTFADAFKLRG
jgi:hypothetical protein